MPEAYMSLSRIGLERNAVTLTGHICDLRTGFYIRYIPKMIVPENFPIRLVDSSNRSIPINFFVAVAWCDADERLWKDSPFAEIIFNARRYFRIPKTDRKSIGIVDTFNNPFVITKNGELWNTTYFKHTYGSELTTGYLGRCIGRTNNLLMHRLVATAFLPIPKELTDRGYTAATLEVNHRDGNKHNNNWFNLEWVTQDRNMEHASQTGLMRSYISDDDLTLIFKMLQNGKTDTEIGNIMNVPAVTINSIRARRSPRYDTREYQWPQSSATAARSQRSDFVSAVIADFNSGMDKYDICYKHRISTGRLTSILMENRDRLTRYYRHNSANLTEQQVRQICELIVARKSNKEIVKETGIDDRLISRIRMRQSYDQWIKDYEFPDPSECDERAQLKRKYTEIILAPENKDLSTTQLAEKYNLKANTINHYKRKLGLRENKVN